MESRHLLIAKEVSREVALDHGRVVSDSHRIADALVPELARNWQGSVGAFFERVVHQTDKVCRRRPHRGRIVTMDDLEPGNAADLGL